MKPRLLPILPVFLLLGACGPEPLAKVPLDPVPFVINVPPEIVPLLSTGPLEGDYAADVDRAGAHASVVLYYQPQNEERVIYLTAYYFPADAFDALQSPDEPPLFGMEVLRGDGKVLSIAGPSDAIFAPDTPDGHNLLKLYGLIYLPGTYDPVR